MANEIGSGNGTGYPSTLDTNNILEQNDNEPAPTLNRAQVVNDLASAIVAIQTELGIDPAGSFSTVKARLDSLLAPISFKSYTLADPGNQPGPFYLSGYYIAPAADANLTQASATVVLGTANISYAAHALCVASGAGSASGGSGTAEVEVSGTSITDDGTRTTSDTEIIVADVTASSTDQYTETAKKWIGQVTYTLQATVDHTTFAFDFNYGFAKYEDFSNNDFTLDTVECVGFSKAADSGFAIQVYHHSTSDWTYSAAAFSPGGTVLTSLNTLHSTEDQIANDAAGGDGPFAMKRVGLATVVTGSGSEGIIIKVTTGTNNSVGYMDAHLGVTFN